MRTGTLTLSSRSGYLIIARTLLSRSSAFAARSKFSSATSYGFFTADTVLVANMANLYSEFQTQNSLYRTERIIIGIMHHVKGVLKRFLTHDQRPRARARPETSSRASQIVPQVTLEVVRDFVIIGGGIVGLATAYRLTERFSDAHIRVLEKEAGVGQHQTGHNSGVLHCGLYYKPGSLKARLAVEGIRQMVAFCAENGVPHEVCGKLVVAADETELPRLKALAERGTANGLKGLELLTPEGIREREPHAAGVAGLRVPE